MAQNEPEQQTDEEYDNPGIAGQIQYPEAEVDAERAAAFASGKVDTLYDPEDDPRNAGWQNPADRSSEVETQDEGDGEDDSE